MITFTVESLFNEHFVVKGIIIQFQILLMQLYYQLKAWRNRLTLPAKHRCPRPDSNVLKLFIADDTEINNLANKQLGKQCYLISPRPNSLLDQFLAYYYLKL